MVNVGERLGLLPQPDFEFEETPEGLKITRLSVFSRKRNTMTLPVHVEDINHWRNGGGMERHLILYFIMN